MRGWSPVIFPRRGTNILDPNQTKTRILKPGSAQGCFFVMGMPWHLETREC